MSYKIIEATTIKILTEKVNNCMEAGFIPLGGVCRGEGSYLYQAMTYEPNTILPTEGELIEQCSGCSWCALQPGANFCVYCGRKLN